jgi:hypothetical protein
VFDSEQSNCEIALIGGAIVAQNPYSLSVSPSIPGTSSDDDQIALSEMINEIPD